VISVVELGIMRIRDSVCKYPLNIGEKLRKNFERLNVFSLDRVHVTRKISSPLGQNMD
jgi:hypothetical protein